MRKRDYAQYCPLTRALEMVGERWALLIIRDLFTGPKRYIDLKAGLPRIPTNVLAARLRELEGSGVVVRRALPRPRGSIVYELTEFGAGVESAVLSLGRWGARRLGDPGPDEIVTADSLVMMIRATFRRGAATGVHATYELHMGPIVLNMRIADGHVEVTEGAFPSADLVIEAGTGLRALMAGEVTPADAVANGSVRLHGDSSLLATFASVFRI